jgi:ribosome-associated toxin RatA of RatAB toxin-antitoxin module
VRGEDGSCGARRLCAVIGGEQTTEIAAGAPAVFAVASDLERYPEWQDFLQRVTVRERDGDGRAALVDADADAKVTALRIELRCEHDAPRRVAWRAVGGDIKGFDGAFHIAEVGPDRTRVTFSLRVDPGFKLGLLLRGGVGDRLRDRILDGMLDGLRRRAQGL